MTGYVFDTEWENERRRIAAIEALFDKGTMRVLEDAGVRPGWRCLEAGAGGGSIARWLGDRVSPDGSVLATDLDTRFAEAYPHPAVEIRRHDVTADDLPEGAFDLVHARCLLEHLPARDEVLKRLVVALKPGGVLVLEDVDFVPDTTLPATKAAVYPPSGARLFSKSWRAMGTLARMVGIDTGYARRLPATLLGAGLRDVGAETRSVMVRGGTPGSDFAGLTLAQLRPMLTSGELMTDREIDRSIAHTADPGRYSFSATVVAAWGRRPAGKDSA